MVFWTGILSYSKSILAAEMYNVVLLHCAGCACVRFLPAVFVVVSFFLAVCYYFVPGLLVVTTGLR